MRITGEVWYMCEECTIGLINGDFSGMDDKTSVMVQNSIDALPQWIVPDFDVESGEGIFEFSKMRCDCCRTHLHGSRHRFGRLEMENK